MTSRGPLKTLDIDRSVTLRQLRTFKAVADLNSFSLAAQHLRLSQPSVSYQVKELEEALGLPLLDRLGKRVHLTEAGDQLYASARGKRSAGRPPATPPVRTGTSQATGTNPAALDIGGRGIVHSYPLGV